MNPDVVIVDYGMGNVGSIKNMLYMNNHSSLISSQTIEIENATRIILPGVGHFDEAIKNLNQLGIFELLRKKALIDKTPILGICLGAQLIGKRSEEGTLNGLNLINFKSLKFTLDINEKQNIIIPNMCFRTVVEYKKSIFSHGLNEQSRFYFVHSYYIPINNQYSALVSDHSQSFTAAIEYENIFGTQFHPEKSHSFGKIILDNFIRET